MLVAVVAAGVVPGEARPKRSVLYAHTAPVVASTVVAAPVVASVPVVHQTSQVVHHNPTTVVKTEQVRSGDHASYTYSQEVKAQPVVHTQTHATQVAVAAAPAAVVSYAHYAYPTAAYSNYGYYGYPYGYSYAASPYSYVLGK